MNHQYPLDDLVLERLVDGELSPGEYERVVGMLDEHPGNWRRCALAFLEDQSLRRDLGSLSLLGDGTVPMRTAPSLGPSSPPHASTAHTSTARTSRSWYSRIVLAACLTLAFVGGYGLRSQVSSRDRSWPLAKPLATTGRSESDAEIRALTNDGSLPDGNSSRGLDELASDDAPEYATLVVDGIAGSEPRHVELPIYPWRQAPSDWARNEGSPVPAHIREALERMGSEVRREQLWMPTSLPDGRQLWIPVDQVEITPPNLRRVSF